MGIRAVVFDVGGVLTRVGPDVANIWQKRLGMTHAEFGKALASVDRDGRAYAGRLSQTDFQAKLSTALGLSAAQADEFKEDMFGELDAELCAYAATLRPRYTTAILSDAIDGARCDYQARYGLEQLVDVIVCA